MLNRGEIAMGPVWVDMFYTWQADGKMSEVKLSLPSPGLPGQPMYYVIPAKAANAAIAKVRRFCESPRSGGRHRQAVQLVSGHRPARQAKLDPAAWNKLFTIFHRGRSVKNGRPFPLSEYFTDIVEGYERVVLKYRDRPSPQSSPRREERVPARERRRVTGASTTRPDAIRGDDCRLARLRARRPALQSSRCSSFAARDVGGVARGKTGEFTLSISPSPGTLSLLRIHGRLYCSRRC
jgi:hypothetical protein